MTYFPLTVRNCIDFCVICYLVGVYWVVMLDGIHFSHRECYCKCNDCNRNAVTNTLLEDTCIGCNRHLKSERQNSLRICLRRQAVKQASKEVVQLILSSSERCDRELWV